MKRLKMVRLSRSLELDSICLLTKDSSSKYSYSRYFTSFISGFIDYKREGPGSYIIIHNYKKCNC